MLSYEIAKMAYCTTEMSETMNTNDLRWIIFQDTYMGCALGYIKSHLLKKFGFNGRPIFEILVFLIYLVKLQ